MKPLLICTDLDRTLLPNGPESESPLAMPRFRHLVAHPSISLAFVSGRDRELVAQAIEEYDLPLPDYVVADVGTTIYESDATGVWQPLAVWAEHIGEDWKGMDAVTLSSLCEGVPGLQLQQLEKQNRHKLSYYWPLESDTHALESIIKSKLQAANIEARLIWSIDEPEKIGLLDVLPQRASKFHALEALMQMTGFTIENTVFCGDSGNDLEVLTSRIPSVLVANSQPEVRQQALAAVRADGISDSLYIARGEFLGMNGHFGAGILEGVAHFHPSVLPLIEAVA